MSTKKTSPIVNSIVDNAFVPDMQEKEPLTAEQKMTAFFESMAAEVVVTPIFALPNNGEHNVVIMSYEYHIGRGDNSDYFSIALKDVEKNNTWNMALSAEPEKVLGFLGEVNMYSNGVVFKLNPLQAFGKLETKPFRVWTQQYDNKGQTKVKTYSNPVGYEKFARYIASQAAQKADKEREYAERKARGDKAPWED